jgi:hypothetical protein
MSEDSGDRLQAAQSAVTPEVAMPQEAVPDAVASPEPNAPAGALAQAGPDDNQPQVERRGTRRAYMRRHTRGNFFFKPFKALRRLKIW